MIQLETDIIQEVPIVLRTNRDAENPAIISFIQSHPDITSLLDIGAHYSHAHYAQALKDMVQRYDGIDILPDETTGKITDNYYVGNANKPQDTWENGKQPPLAQYDCVTSVSVFEHAGLSTYTADHNTEVLSLFETCLKMAKKYVWVSFDAGQHHVTENQHSPITFPIYMQMLEMAKEQGWNTAERFFYTQGSQAGHPWYEHKKRDVAFKIPYIYYIGNQSIAVLELTK